MKKIGNITKQIKALLLSVFVLCVLGINLSAQVEVRADVNTTTVNLDEEIKLTVYVSAPSTKIETPQMPSLPNFNIYSAGQSRQVNMVNGKVSALMQYNYILTPRFAGKTTIGAFTVKVAGQTYATEPIEVEIFRQTPSAPRTQAQTVEQEQNRQSQAQLEENGYNPNAKLPSFFMTAQTNTKKAYINEQITLKIRFYQSANILGQPIYEKPQLKGLFAEDLATRQGQERFGNKTYYYTEIESALFGLVSGVAEIGSASVTYTSAESFFDAFDVFFKGANSGQTNKVESDILFVDIVPLPSKNKPSTFYGAVGTNFEIKSALDMAQVSAGEPITLTITVTGTGNLAAVKEISLPDLGPSFRVYETSSNLTNKIAYGKINGTKVYKTVIVPRASGVYKIPQIAFSYFDTKSKTYNTINTEELTIKVSPPVAEDSKTLSFTEQNGGGAASQIQHLTTDISYLKNLPQSRFNKIVLYFADLGNNNFYALALMLIAVLITLIRRGNISLTGSFKYYLKAKRSVKQAEKLDELPEILKTYLESKMNTQIGLKSIEEVAKQLSLDSLTAKKMIDLWNHLAMLKYAPSASHNALDTLNEEKRKILSLLNVLEKEIK